MAYHRGRKLTARADNCDGGEPTDGLGCAEASDESLVLAIARARDKQAFAALFRRYAPRMKGVLMRAGAPADIADEAAQEAMLAIWRRAESFDPSRASAAAWIYAILRNKRIDMARKAARVAADRAQPMVDGAAEPDAEIVYGVERRNAKIRAAVRELSEDQKRVVLLSFFEGRTHAEIAEALDLPIGTVKSRIRLAFGKIRASLGDAFRGELFDE